MTDHASAEAAAAFHHAVAGEFATLERNRSWRPGERARALQVPKPPPVMDGQDSLFPELL